MLWLSRNVRYKCLSWLVFLSVLSVALSFRDNKRLGGRRKRQVTSSDALGFDGDYLSYAKYLWIRASNYNLPADRLSCTDIDPKKEFLMVFDDKEGVRMCDICPTLPFSKFKNLFVNVQPLEVHSNIPYAECFGACSARNECVAYSYDHENVICYTFNSTTGKFRSESNWTTVLMNQPTGIVFRWSYSRHTIISTSNGTTPLQTSTEASFLVCLSRCQDTAKCKAVSYVFESKSCLQFTGVAKDSGNFVDFKYGVISAFDIESVSAADDNKWRFLEEEQVAASIPENVNQTKGPTSPPKCPAPGDGLGAFYAMKCLTVEALGCDANTGCQSCYYPEKINSYRRDLIICPDSTFVDGRNQKEKLASCYNDCVNKTDCIAIDFDPSQLTCDIVSYTAWRPKNPSDDVRRFTLKFSKLMPNLAQFSILPRHGLGVVAGSKTQMEEISTDDLDKCLAECIKRPFCTKAAYSKTKKCQMASSSATTTDVQAANADSNVYIRRAKLTSALLAFFQLPGWKLTGTPKATEQYPCDGKDCSEQLPRCTDSCLSKYSKWCNIISVDYEASRVTCNFFNGTEDTDLVPSSSSEVYTRFFQTNFSLENLNARDMFEEKDFYNCFTNDSTSATLSAVAGYDTILYDHGSTPPSSPQLSRRKRGFFSAIGNFFKKAAKAVVDVVKDTVKTVVDTAKGVVKTVGNVIKGDFNGAKDAFLNIPIVKDVKEAGENVIKIGKGVVTGDWKSVGNAALGLATSNLFDYIPGVGRVAKTGGQILKDVIGKGAKKSGRDAEKVAKDNIGNQASKDRIDRQGSNDKPDKDRPDNDKDKDKPDRCKRANTPSQPGSSSSCNNKNLKCYKPSIENVMGVSIKTCGMRKVNEKCDFFCEPGYLESNNGEFTCESTPKSNKADWKPKPTCNLVLCNRVSDYHVIPVEIPGDIRGKYRVAYVAYFDENRRLPVWSVAFHDLINNLKNKKFGRSAVAGFIPHPCKIKQATSAEYKGSGWHQGHLTPINVMLYHQKAAKGSNMFINIAPQSPTINTGAWKTLEMKVQCFTQSKQALVATGVCHKSSGAKLGTLSVPSCFWKMICYKDKSDKVQVVGFYGPNEKLSKTDVAKKKAARETIFTPRSQTDVKAFASDGDPFYMGSATSDPWRISAVSIYKSATIPPFLATSCTEATALDPDAEKEWKERLAPKGKVGRRKRDVSGSTCSAADEEELAALFGLDSFDQDESEIDNPDESEDDGSGGGGGKFAGASCGKRLIGYYPSWGDKEITHQQASRLTHIVYAFLETKADGSISIGSADPTHSTDPGGETALSQKRLDKLMKVAGAADVKVMFAVGGWENSQYFSSIAASPGSRMNFIANVIKILQEHNFDGVDIDWEYPVTGGAQEGVPSDKENYVQLMKELREVLNQHQQQTSRADPFLISFAGAAGQWTLDPGYDLPGLLKYADWVNVMTYDYFGAWGSKWGAYTGPPAPLYFAMPPRFSGKTNVDWTVKYYVCRSKQPHKINMGVPFYGRFWRNVGAPVDASDNMWRTAEAVGGKFDGGYEPWRKLKAGWLQDPSFQKAFHEKAKAPYAINAAQRIFLGYEDPQSLKIKADYAADHNVGGLMIWAIDQDDDQNTMMNALVGANLCKNTDPKAIEYKCSPITDKRWWTSEDGDDVAGLCGRSAPLYKGYYPVCDPDDPGYSCCGKYGYCGTGEDYCKCDNCADYRSNPNLIVEEPVKPTVPVLWYFLNAADGKRGRCGRDVAKINNEYPICNPDDKNAHCCSNGGYCGINKEFCECTGCIDFKVRKDYRYGPRKWWIVADGQDKAGTCGRKAQKINGAEAECNPDDPGFHCCSPAGYCGKGEQYCTCDGCVEYKK